MSTPLPSPDTFYLPFVRLVQKSFQAATTDQEAERLLNGAAADEVHTKVPRPIRSKDGIFFSGHSLSQEAASLAKDFIDEGKRVFDPACGAGDLLIAAARLMPLQNCLEDTLKVWGHRLGGTDLHHAFVQATKWRLALLAKSRHQIYDETSVIDIDSCFENIKTLDYLQHPDSSFDFDCVIVNPPFGHRTADADCTWSTGRTQLAAIFLDKVAKSRRPGQIVVAILPDVLRGGTRYKKWRQMIAGQARAVNVNIYGRFEKRTDVDVFISRYEFQCAPSVIADNKDEVNTSEKIGDRFVIRVGSVVPHRDDGKKGPWRPYLKVGNAPPNGETVVDVNRRYKGGCFKTPFVAIRRTSNPADKNRIVCTLVTGPDLVAVENHLIVATPISGSLEDCRKVVKVLSSQYAIDHINQQLRCRHLTTGALKSLPLEDWDGKCKPQN